MLKAFCLSTALLLTCIANAQEQRSIGKELGYGLRAGANFSTFHLSDGKLYAIESKSTGGLIAYHIGAYMLWNFKEKSKVLCELSYSRKGGDISRMVGPYDGGTIEYRMDYLSIPVLFRYYVFNRIIVELGPEVSLLIHQNEKKKIKRGDVAAVAGVGYFINSRLLINTRYGYGWQDINNEPGYERTGKWHNRTTQVGLSYRVGRALKF